MLLYEVNFRIKAITINDELTLEYESKNFECNLSYDQFFYLCSCFEC